MRKFDQPGDGCEFPEDRWCTSRCWWTEDSRWWRWSPRVDLLVSQPPSDIEQGPVAESVTRSIQNDSTAGDDYYCRAFLRIRLTTPTSSSKQLQATASVSRLPETLYRGLHPSLGLVTYLLLISFILLVLVLSKTSKMTSIASQGSTWRQDIVRPLYFTAVTVKYLDLCFIYDDWRQSRPHKRDEKVVAVAATEIVYLGNGRR